MSKKKKIPGKILKEAKTWLSLAEKALNYRKDLLTPESINGFSSAIEQLDEVLENPERRTVSPDEITKAQNSVIEQLRQHGGNYYHTRNWTDNMEMFLVAIIVIIGIRTFFFQPFKIPTNSMYPTYNGMTYEFFETAADEPSTPERIFRKVTLFTKHYSTEAPVDGEVLIPIATDGHRYNVAGGRLVKGRKWGILPAKFAQYTLYVDESPVTIQVPDQFNFQSLVKDVFGDTAHQRIAYLKGVGAVLRTGRVVKKGEKVLSFDILTGDQLFVDRITYHFRAPRVGDPFVFSTDNIPGMEADQRGKYYVKRLAGEGGDVLQIKEPVLYRNDQPAEENDAFICNANQEGEYEGYTDEDSRMKYLYEGTPYKVPEDCYFALGDNSDQSLDSRFWGPVPKTEVVGRAILIYYPFTHRWGNAK
ncbi:MAG: signal peptidase I [Opitutales bacterium]|nr:signal peptidase I [Opitutales bacterium]